MPGDGSLDDSLQGPAVDQYGAQTATGFALPKISTQRCAALEQAEMRLIGLGPARLEHLVARLAGPRKRQDRGQHPPGRPDVIESDGVIPCNRSVIMLAALTRRGDQLAAERAHRMGLTNRQSRLPTRALPEDEGAPQSASARTRSIVTRSGAIFASRADTGLMAWNAHPHRWSQRASPERRGQGGRYCQVGPDMPGILAQPGRRATDETASITWSAAAKCFLASWSNSRREMVESRNRTGAMENAGRIDGRCVLASASVGELLNRRRHDWSAEDTARRRSR